MHLWTRENVHRICLGTACGLLLSATPISAQQDARSEFEPMAVETVAAVMVDAVGSHTGDGEESCTFAIRAKNNLSFDVWVDLYDSRVTNHAVIAKLFQTTQLKIQNQRIPRGGTMDRRATVSGRCSAKRTWNFNVRIGGREWTGKTVTRTTRGTSSTSRTVDLGSSSRWGL